MPTKSDPRRTARSGEAPRGEAFRSELERRGLSESFARSVSEQIEPFAGELSSDQVEAVLAGVTLAWNVHRRDVEAVCKTAGDLDEVQRLLGAFAGELRKLDEALELLAAYAVRLRTRALPGGEPTLH